MSSSDDEAGYSEFRHDEFNDEEGEEDSGDDGEDNLNLFDSLNDSEEEGDEEEQEESSEGAANDGFEDASEEENETPKFLRPPEAKSSTQAESNKEEKNTVEETKQAVTTGSKYIPPSLRKKMAAESDENLELTRKLRGLLNRVSELNLVHIVNDIHALYQSNSRHGSILSLHPFHSCY